MSEFSARPFVAGSLVGMRAFAVDPLGRLIGPSFNQVFAPGENVAECRRPVDDYYMFAAGGMVSSFSSFFQPSTLFGRYYMGGPSGGSVTYEEPTEEEQRDREAKLKAERQKAVEEYRRKEEERKRTHSLAGLTCTCGFYAYFNGRNDYAEESSTVAAIIEGYGVCTVGSAGFRASKARLLALVEPGNRLPWMQVKRNYPDVPTFEFDDEAIAAFPLSVEQLPSPDEADFWTREAR